MDRYSGMWEGAQLCWRDLEDEVINPYLRSGGTRKEEYEEQRYSHVYSKLKARCSGHHHYSTGHHRWTIGHHHCPVGYHRCCKVPSYRFTGTRAPLYTKNLEACS